MIALRRQYVVGHYERGILERVRYTPYGRPMGFVEADQNLDGLVDTADGAAFLANYTAGSALADINFDARVDTQDTSPAYGASYTATAGTTGGLGRLSPYLDNRVGYAGYRLGLGTGYSWHVRFRDLICALGVWNRRDPIGYADGRNLYQYAGSRPVWGIDPLGLQRVPSCGSGCGGSSGGGGDSSTSQSRPSRQSNAEFRASTSCRDKCNKEVENFEKRSFWPTSWPAPKPGVVGGCRNVAAEVVNQQCMMSCRNGFPISTPGSRRNRDSHALEAYRKCLAERGLYKDNDPCFDQCLENELPDCQASCARCDGFDKYLKNCLDFCSSINPAMIPALEPLEALCVEGCLVTYGGPMLIHCTTCSGCTISAHVYCKYRCR